jgi:hypothetical protein
MKKLTSVVKVLGNFKVSPESSMINEFDSENFANRRSPDFKNRSNKLGTP